MYKHIEFKLLFFMPVLINSFASSILYLYNNIMIIYSLKIKPLNYHRLKYIYLVKPLIPDRLFHYRFLIKLLAQWHVMYIVYDLNNKSFIQLRSLKIIFLYLTVKLKTWQYTNKMF